MATSNQLKPEALRIAAAIALRNVERARSSEAKAAAARRYCDVVDMLESAETGK